MKCHFCGAMDSMCVSMYLDRNQNIFSESELEAFRILHPEASDVSFEKVLVCGICMFEADLRGG